MAFLDMLAVAWHYVWSLFLYWLSMMFVFPFRDLEVLWILLPVWLNLIFTDFFQERRGASLGNAITNGIVQAWVGVDWMRFLWRTYPGASWLLALKVFICLLVLVHGVSIVIQSLKHNKSVQAWGRVRVTSYVMIMLSPIVYNIVQPSLYYLLAAVVYFPVFYYFLELIERFVPDIEEDDSSKFTLPSLK